MTDHATMCKLSPEYHKHDKIFYHKEKNPRINRLYVETSNVQNFSKCEVKTSLGKGLYCSFASSTCFEDDKHLLTVIQFLL